MIEQASIYLTAMILGIMLFFSFVIAPVVFTTLDENEKQDKKFKYSHFISVVINFVQMIFLVLLLI
jgi:large-conductance mechanosensitive channel